MLVLSRKTGERLVINGDIIVTVTEIAGGKVKIGIEAPREVKILRGELVDALPAPILGNLMKHLDQDEPDEIPSMVRPVHHRLASLPGTVGSQGAPRLKRIPR